MESTTTAGTEEDLSSSCFANTHSVAGRPICLVKRPDGKWFVDCKDGRQAIIGDYNWALTYCDPSVTQPPPPPVGCHVSGSGACISRRAAGYYGVCTYTCGDGTSSSKFVLCPSSTGSRYDYPSCH